MNQTNRISCLLFYIYYVFIYKSFSFTPAELTGDSGSNLRHLQHAQHAEPARHAPM